MSSNWTVVVFTQMVTGRSLSLSLVVVVVVVVGDIYIPQSDRRYVCSGVSPSFFSLRCSRCCCCCAFGGALFFFFVFFFVQKLDWKKLSDEGVLTI